MILVTGGAGFIGSALIWGLNKRGVDNILVVDNLGFENDKWKNLSGLKFRDYMSKDRLLEYLNGNRISFRSVLHMGACSSTTEQDCNYLINNNYEYSKQLALFCIRSRTQFIYASSAATYGDGSRGFSDKTPIEQLRPLNMYGFSKHMFDLWLLKNSFTEQVTGLKFFNVWGPNEYHKKDMRSMVVRAWEQIKASGRVKLFKSYHPDYADGMQQRDFVYIKDVVNMVLQLWEKPTVKGLFNIGSGRASTWVELVSPIFEALQLEPQIDFIPMPEELRGKYQYYTQAEMQKYADAGLQVRNTGLSDAVSDFVLNYLEPGKYLDSGE